MSRVKATTRNGEAQGLATVGSCRPGEETMTGTLRNVEL